MNHFKNKFNSRKTVLITGLIFSLSLLFLTSVLLSGRNKQPENQPSVNEGLNNDSVNIGKDSDNEIPNDGKNNEEVKDADLSKESPNKDNSTVQKVENENNKDISKPNIPNKDQKPGNNPVDKPSAGEDTKPSGKPIDKQGDKTCSIIPKSTVKEYSSMYFENDPVLKDMGRTGRNGEKCTAIVTTTLDGKVINTKTITVSEITMAPDEIWIGTKKDTVAFWAINHAYFTTIEAAKSYANSFQGQGIYRRIWNEVGENSASGRIFYTVRFEDDQGQPIYKGGWSDGHAEFTISGNRVYRK